MARVWMEGFEDGLPHGYYLEGSPNTNHIYGLSMQYPAYYVLSTGRNAYSQYALRNKISQPTTVQKLLDTALNELYYRVYVKCQGDLFGAALEIIGLKSTAGNYMLSIYQPSVGTTYQVRARIGGSYASVGNITLLDNTWYRVEMYLKIDSSTGAYNVKIDGVSAYSASSVDTGTASINVATFGHTPALATNNLFHYDDIALNDTNGTRNNSWVGDTTIVALKPNGAGDKSQWNVSQGWATAEASSNTTTTNITGHGLATNDVAYNVTRDAYRIVTKVNDNQFTVTSVTGQTAGDTILLFSNVASITAAAGTDTSKAIIPGHTLESYDVIVNTSRSDAIRRVIYVDGTTVYNRYASNDDYLGTVVTSQAAGDTIKTFKVAPYAISDHYKAVNTTSPNPIYSNIQSTVSAQIDTFDMQELVADKSVSASAKVIAASVNIYAKEQGAGSQIKAVIRTGGTDYKGTTVSMIGGTYEYQTIFEDNPDTSAQWAISEIDGVEAGVEVV